MRQTKRSGAPGISVTADWFGDLPRAQLQAFRGYAKEAGNSLFNVQRLAGRSHQPSRQSVFNGFFAGVDCYVGVVRTFRRAAGRHASLAGGPLQGLRHKSKYRPSGPGGLPEPEILPRGVEEPDQSSSAAGAGVTVSKQDTFFDIAGATVSARVLHPRRVFCTSRSHHRFAGLMGGHERGALRPQHLSARIDGHAEVFSAGVAGRGAALLSGNGVGQQCAALREAKDAGAHPTREIQQRILLTSST